MPGRSWIKQFVRENKKSQSFEKAQARHCPRIHFCTQILIHFLANTLGVFYAFSCVNIHDLDYFYK